MLKTCSKCWLEKPYFPEEKKDSKASGFKGAVCWNCYLEAIQKTRSTEEGRQKANAASVKCITARLETNAWFRLKMRLGQETRQILKDLAKGRGTNIACFKIFGKSRETVFAHIDAQLTARGFKWENHGTEWQLDHRKPLALAQSSIELYQLCLLENTQVLTPEENRAKAIEDRELIREFEARQV